MKKNIFILLTLVFIIFIKIKSFSQATTIPVGTTVTWNTPGTYGDISIFGTLKITNTTISMLSNAKITIQIGGKLEINNGTLTSYSSDDWWHGIIVEGTTLTSPPPDYHLYPDRYRGSLIVNESIIEYAIGAIRFQNDGKIICNDSYFQNNYILGLYLGPENRMLSPDIELSNIKFINNASYGIKDVGNNLTLDLSTCQFIGNSIGYLFEDDEIYSNKKIEYSIFKDNYFAGIYISGIKDYYYFNNCSFFDKDTGIRIEGGDSKVEVVNCTFDSELNSENTAFDIRSGNNIHLLANDIYNHEYGILMGSLESSLFADLEFEYNYFYNCNTAIEISGFESSKPMKIDHNFISNCEFGIYSMGMNHFMINENDLFSNDYSINIGSSGDQENTIQCNGFITPLSGLQIHWQNENTTFTNNSFSNTSWQDVILRNSDIADDIGSKAEPAMNFFSANGGDIAFYHPPDDHFNYWLPKDPVPHTDPVHLPSTWKDNSDISYSSGCEIVLPIKNVVIDTVKAWINKYCFLYQQYTKNPTLKNRKLLVKVKRQLIIYMNNYFQTNGKYLSWAQIEALLKYGCNKWFFQKKLFTLYVSNDLFFKADSLLNEIQYSLREIPLNNPVDSLERISKESLVNIYRIGLRYLADTTRLVEPFTFDFSLSEISVLYNESVKNIPESGFARSLYYIATGTLLPPVYIEPSLLARATESKSGQNEANIWQVYPNPVLEYVNIWHYGKFKINTTVMIYDINGKILYNKNHCFLPNSMNKLDFSDNDSGIYLMSIKDESGNLLKNEKLIIIK